MAVIGFRRFEGEIPKAPPHLLPEAASQYAQGCKLTRKILEPFPQPVSAFTAPVNPVQSIYTEDGVSFYVWAYEAWPVKSPVIDEQYQRVYWIDKNQSPSMLKATPGVERVLGLYYASPTGYLVGVPTPTVAPVLSTSILSSLPGYDGGSWEFEGWWEADGKKYDRVQVTNYAVQTQQWTQWTIPASSIPKSAGTPSEAYLVVEVRFIHSGKAVMRLSSGASENPARSSAFPGGIEMTLRLDSSGTLAYVELSWGEVETRAYVYTATNTWNEESAPSPATLISVRYYEQVQVKCTKPAWVNYRPFNDFNIYHTFGANTTYLKVSKTLVGVDGSIYTYKDPPSNSTNLPSAGLVTQLWAPPPRGLVGMVMMPNGWMAAFKSNVLYMSEPFRPHTWPYSITFTRDIVGLCVGASGLVVTTVDGCYVVNGVHPSSVTQMKLPIPQSGISMRSMANVNGAVAFASPDGIVLVAGSQASLAPANQYFDRSTWKSRYGAMLATLSFAYFDGGLMAFDSASQSGFWMSTDESADGSTFTEFNLRGRAFTYVPQLDQLYFADGNLVYAFGEGASNQTLTWKSKDFVLPAHACFAIGYIRTDANVTASVALVADGTFYSLTNTTGTQYFRLPSTRRALRWSVLVTADGPVHELFIATSVGELKNA